MELLLWVWLWDRRFFFNIKHPRTPQILANLWAIPLLLNIAIFILASRLTDAPSFSNAQMRMGEEYKSTRSSESCSDALKSLQGILTLYIIVLGIDSVASFGTLVFGNLQIKAFLEARNKALVQRDKEVDNLKAYKQNQACTISLGSQVTANTQLMSERSESPSENKDKLLMEPATIQPYSFQETSHATTKAVTEPLLHLHSNFWLRTSIVQSIVGQLLFVSSLLLYIISWRDIQLFNQFLNECPQAKQTVAQTYSFYIMLHAWVQILSGSLVLGQFLLNVSLNLLTALCYALCPLKLLAFQRSLSEQDRFVTRTISKCCCKRSRIEEIKEL